jgi:L-threonylcarbamoyladenylate synthase
MTTVLRIDPAQPDPGAIERAAACLRSGGLVAFPTETVYGLGAHALDVAAVRGLFDAKQRPAYDPLIVHVAEFDQLTQIVERVPAVSLDLARRFWPGPLTLVLPRAARVPMEVTGGLDTVAVRIPSHPVAAALLGAARLPIAAPSANLFSRPSPTQAAHVLHDLDGRIDMVLDGGPTTVGVESTVLDLTSTAPTILRPGAVTIEALRELLPDVRIRDVWGAPDVTLPSPGLLSTHYAPLTPLTLFEGGRDAALDRLVDAARQAVDDGKRVGVLVAREDVDRFGEFPVRISEIGSEGDLAGIAARLYAAVRELDAAGVDLILARDVGGREGLGPAIRDRLRRAAVKHVVVDG